MTPDALAETLKAKAGGKARFLVAIAGAPGSGKSTLSDALVAALNSSGLETSALVPMDGYHYDNSVIEPLGLLPRKGSPETFNTAGLFSDLRRISSGEADVAVPVFDRSIDLARANARIVARTTPIILVEGNYLLLDAPDWRDIAALFDLSIFLDVDESELERRLVQRWLDYGFDDEAARAKAFGNDIPNARLVQHNSRKADIVMR
ncbi:MAG: nucleoside triphosphate hydrolase [Nitratireductor sp.]|nr:nucleoside triphosphate hydrolase [Nitratireductor sp.]